VVAPGLSRTYVHTLPQTHTHTLSLFAHSTHTHNNNNQEFIFFVIALLGSGNLLGKLRRHIVGVFSQQTHSQQQQQQQQQQQVDDAPPHSGGGVNALYSQVSFTQSLPPCPLCGISTPHTPHQPEACDHVHCYYCLSVALLRDSTYRCAVCGVTAGGLRRLQVV
jgi:hypothetical protein